MNKTITSNIAGYVFHIDENAFNKLDAYLNTIRSYFTDSQGKDEIIADIEARLAEMLHEKIGDMKQVVSLEDVNQVIIIMGQPEAFIDDDPESAGWTEQKSQPSGSETKRLFRDPDNKVIGGVCAGVSNYLGLGDAIWLRLALVISFFFFGTGFLLYLILLIIIPEAKTTADKLHMRGENVTVSNIEKRVNEELGTVKNKWNDLHGNSGAGRKIGNLLHRIITLVGSLVLLLIKFIGKIIGFAFVVVGVIGLLSVIGVPFGLPTIISLGSEGAMSALDVQDIFHNLVGGTGMITWITITGILVWGIPMAALAFFGVKLLFNFRSHNRGIGLSFLGLWIVGLFMSFAISMIVASDFSSEGSNTETVEIQLNSDQNQVINLALNHELGDDEPTFETEIFNLNLLTPGNSSQLYGKPELNINMAKTGGPKLLIKRTARAKKKQDAVERSSKIDYGFAANDTAILFNGYFEIPEDELWRTQEVDLELLIPVGYTIYLSDEMMQIIYDIKNTTNTYDGDMVGRRWIMTPDGLACVDCDGLTKPKKSTNVDVDIDIDDMNIRIKMKEKQEKLEIRQQRLEKEMKERQRELEKIEEELEKQESEETEEASIRPQEILLKRVINATYKLSPTISRTISISYPG
ncbi:MAG: phage shock protein PspC (stress-responsive transcriptional regulator) [Bacteroidia bacterium]|jgi:phage shock protein PspC (stress-responsive transcriptional regulator)